MIGKTLSHFEVTARLGEGGMGQVYRATDRRLERDVAIKVLPREVADDPERLARIEREAKVLASLNHPGIVAIYSLETAEEAASETEDGGPKTVDDDHWPRVFLVMELVEGRTLAEEISQGGMSMERFFELAIPLASTLAVAHQHGIVHRDIKPQNVMVTSAGEVKVLDFGLAKRSAGSVRVGEDAPTKTLENLTKREQILGTSSYMSPEQIHGRELDERSDLFSLGVVLFEMLARRRPFSGESSIERVSSILKDPPEDLERLRLDAPSPLCRLLEECLAKDREDRISSAEELRGRLVEIEAGESGDVEARSSVRRPSEKAEPDPSTVAVLPFTNLGGSEEADFLATGLHNDLVTELSRVPGLTILSRTSVLRYQQGDKPLSVVGRELGAGTIVEGTVQSAGRRVRLTAQLTNAANDLHLWAERYDRELSAETVFDLQSEVATSVVRSLERTLSVAMKLPSGQRLTTDLETYRLCTMGQVELDQRTEASMRRAAGYFAEAAKRDPEYALAHVGVAQAASLMVAYGHEAVEAALPQIEAAARRALALDPESAEAHAAISQCHALAGGHREARRELEEATRIRPSYAEAHNWLSIASLLAGWAEKALAHARRAVALNPLSAESVSNLSLSLLATGEPEEAILEAQRVLELSPGYGTAFLCQALAHVEMGQYEEGESLLSGIELEWTGLGVQATRVVIRATLGEESGAREALDEIDPEVDAFSFGLARLALGEIDAAFESFDRVGRASWWHCLAVHHFFGEVWEPVRDDPRFRELVRRAHASMEVESPS